MPSFIRVAILDSSPPAALTYVSVCAARVVRNQEERRGETEGRNFAMHIKPYLQRINYDGPLEPGIQTLSALQETHLLTVPFENLDIPLEREIKLDEAALYYKIVEQQRGGFCYELNGLFASLLRTLGFKVTMLSAGVAHAEGGFGPE